MQLVRPAWSAAARERRYNRLAERGWLVADKGEFRGKATDDPSKRERERGRRGREGGCCLDSAADKFRVIGSIRRSTYEHKVREIRG